MEKDMTSSIYYQFQKWHAQFSSLERTEVSSNFLHPNNCTATLLTRQGIGFAITHRLATRTPEDTFLLAVRSTPAGEQAIQQLRALGVTSNLQVLELDVTNDTHILAAAQHIEFKFGKLDGRHHHILPAPTSITLH